MLGVAPPLLRRWRAGREANKCRFERRQDIAARRATELREMNTHTDRCARATTLSAAVLLSAAMRAFAAMR